MVKGKFFVFESIDGGGSETQSKMLVKLLEEKGIPCLFLDYPDYGRPIGNFIHNYLYGNNHIPVGVKFVLYTADMLKDRDTISKALEEGKTVVCCRYVTTALAYQVIEGFDSKRALDFVALMGFPVPDLAIYLKIKPETSKKRKLKEKGSLDRNESDLQLLSKVAARYEDMAKKNIFCRWAVVDGERPIDNVFADVKKALGF
jgi:dTMP kinase